MVRRMCAAKRTRCLPYIAHPLALCFPRLSQPGYEAEETIKRIKSHKGVQAVLIVNQEGVPIYSSTSDEEFAIDHAALISQLAAKAKSTIRTLDPTNDMTFLRIRSKKHEIMIAPGTSLLCVIVCGALTRISLALSTWHSLSYIADKEYALIVIQNPNPGTDHEAADAS